MDVVLPLRIKNEKKFFDCAFKLGFDEMSAHKFLYITQQSDLDIYPKMGDERLGIILYCWEMCEDYKQKLDQDEWELPEELETMLKIIVPWSLDIWFSKEWDRCKILLKHALIHCLNRARNLLMRLPDMMQINWDFLLLYNLAPWQVTYLKSLTVTKEKTLETGALTIETEEHPATNEDITYIKLEQLPLIVLRLVKLFDQSSIDMVKTLCMRVIAAWNKVHYNELKTGGSRLPYVPPEDKRCLLLICHIYLMGVYESDDVEGYVIDNMISNMRFYYQGFQTSYAMDTMKYTPARLIALTCIHLRLQKREFFDFFIWNSFDTSLVNLFGVVSQAYKSYLLGNLLMELNNMNEDDFAANVALYKRLMNSYVNEREKSEIFMMNELQKLEAQYYAHNVIQCVPNITDFKSKICKGNRMSNIGNYENTDDIVDNHVGMPKTVNDGKEEDIGKKENDLRVDPIFQNIPNNQDILYSVYEVLAKKSYRGWHFAKIVLLFKIISHELNMIETWRYHPGLTTSFMLNLETKLSQHYTDLAKIFKDYPFIEQEFWLTAFYLNPTSYNYEAVKRLGIRSNRKRNDEQGRCVTGKDKIEAKYGLLSSTIDVKEIAVLSNTEEQDRDYEPLFQALCSLHLPDNMVKDILTVVFLARNKSFSWAVDWGDLRRRCKLLMSNASEKKRFVELNMAEANDRLKFLKIDYDKYKNRPQLDYGSIEQGYENLMNSAELDDESEESEEEDFEDDEDVYESKKSRGNKKPEETMEDDNSQEDDPYLTGKRRTRARTAAAMASYMFASDLASRKKRRKKDDDGEETDEKAIENEEKSIDLKTAELIDPITLRAMEQENSRTPEIPKKKLKACLKERPLYANPTHGFQPLIDMWNIEKSDLETIDSECVSLLESSSVLNRFVKLTNIKKEINPNEEEIGEEKEMLLNYDDLVKAKREDMINTAMANEETAAKREVPERIAESQDSRDDIQKNGASPVNNNSSEPTNCSASDSISKQESINQDKSNLINEGIHGTMAGDQVCRAMQTNMEGKQREEAEKDSSETISDAILSHKPQHTRPAEMKEREAMQINEQNEKHHKISKAIKDNYEMVSAGTLPLSISMRRTSDKTILNVERSAFESLHKKETQLREKKSSEKMSIGSIEERLDNMKNGTDTNENMDQTHINAVDMPLSEDEESSSDKSTDDDYKLKQLCLTKPLKVLIRRLRASELGSLRQPKVRLKRIRNVEVYVEQLKAQRRRFKRKVYIDVDESSDNSLVSNTSSSDAYRPPKSRTKPLTLRRHALRQQGTSESECDSIKSQMSSGRRRLSTPNASSNQSNNSARSSSRPPTANLIVTPRSASGLKLRISHADQQTPSLRSKSNLSSLDEIIQLSSSSNDTNTMDSITEVVEIPDVAEIPDPLFEEEIII